MNPFIAVVFYAASTLGLIIFCATSKLVARREGIVVFVGYVFIVYFAFQTCWEVMRIITLLP